MYLCWCLWTSGCSPIWMMLWWTFCTSLLVHTCKTFSAHVVKLLGLRDLSLHLSGHAPLSSPGPHPCQPCEFWPELSNFPPVLHCSLGTPVSRSTDRVMDCWEASELPFLVSCLLCCRAVCLACLSELLPGSLKCVLSCRTTWWCLRGWGCNTQPLCNTQQVWVRMFLHVSAALLHLLVELPLQLFRLRFFLRIGRVSL